jgi:hypothetical protein
MLVEREMAADDYRQASRRQAKGVHAMNYGTLLLGAVLLLASILAARAGFDCGNGIYVEYTCANPDSAECRTNNVGIVLTPSRRQVQMDLRLDATKDQATLNGKACRRVSE